LLNSKLRRTKEHLSSWLPDIFSHLLVIIFAFSFFWTIKIYMSTMPRFVLTSYICCICVNNVPLYRHDIAIYICYVTCLIFMLLYYFLWNRPLLYFVHAPPLQPTLTIARSEPLSVYFNQIVKISCIISYTGTEL
jgi:hypothetical protein